MCESHLIYKIADLGVGFLITEALLLRLRSKETSNQQRSRDSQLSPVTPERKEGATRNSLAARSKLPHCATGISDANRLISLTIVPIFPLSLTCDASLSRPTAEKGRPCHIKAGFAVLPHRSGWKEVTRSLDCSSLSAEPPPRTETDARRCLVKNNKCLGG